MTVDSMSISEKIALVFTHRFFYLYGKAFSVKITNPTIDKFIDMSNNEHLSLILNEISMHFCKGNEGIKGTIYIGKVIYYYQLIPFSYDYEIIILDEKLIDEACLIIKRINERE